MAGNRTRGHNFKIAKPKGKKDVRKHSFPNRAIDEWNNLLDSVVQATSIGDFKRKYDALKMPPERESSRARVH